MLDLIVSGGTVVTPHGSGLFDVGVKDGRIATVSTVGGIVAEAHRTIDASGKLVVPGGIDPHTHCAWPVWQVIDDEMVYSAGPDHVSKAALFGGTTTLIDFAVYKPGDTLQETIERTDEIWKGNCHGDFAYHLMLQGEPPKQTIEQIPEVVEAGHASVKFFTTDVTPARAGRKMKHGLIWEVLTQLARCGGIASVHAEDDEIVMHNYERYTAANKVGIEYISHVHTSLAEDLAFRRVVRMAEHIEGCALYMMHVSAASGVQVIGEARAKGMPVYGETLHQYTLFTDEDYKRVNGQIYHTFPGLKSEEDRLALWEGIRAGHIGAIGTDAICTPLSIKTHGERFDNVTGGNVGVEPRMSVMYTEAVTRRGLSVERFADLTSTNAARYLGLYPRKGAIAAGSDADLAVFDLGLDFELALEHLHESDYSPWVGTRLTTWPSMTILRGKVVVEDGEFHGRPSDGEWVPRRLSDDVRQGRLS
jgi:dihydropyrimidinase